MDDLTKEFVAESQEGLERMERCLTDLEQRPGDKDLVGEIFRSVHTIKGTTGFLGLGRLETLAHAGENLLGAVRDGKLPVTSELISGLLDLMDGLRAILRLIETTGGEGVRSTDDDCDLIARLAGLKQGSVGLRAVDDPTAHKRQARHPALPMEKMAPAEETSAATGLAVGTAASTGAASAGAAAASLNDKTLRIDVEVLNRMMNLVGELVLTRNQILQSNVSAENFPELARRLDSVTAELRESVMQARMQPVGHLFGKFPRMVRDLARACGRQVRVEFEGRETGLDKSLLEAIRDPLTHAVRNAVDHGIESPEQRVRLGKPAEGVVRLRAFHHGGSVVIEVIDDGGGIPVKRVLAKAVERGVATEEQAAQMPDREVLDLLFLPGFTMTTEVTHVSGRGVGMDVVRANVEKVGGSVELESALGKGTTLRLRVPLTLAIIPALVVRSGGESFALPQNCLVELVYVPEREVATVVERIGTAELYRLRDRLLPLVWLDRLIGLEAAREGVAGLYIAVVESEGCRYGLVVDDLMAPEEIVVKPLSNVLREIGVFSGATVLGNGRLAMILDVAATAARAGVRPIVEGTRAAAVDAGPGAGLELGIEASVVIFEVMRGERMAMPLSAVERIETVALREIEYAGGRPVLQYRGELLPLEDEGGALRSGAGQADANATVLICLRPGSKGARRVGVVVARVLDVSAGMLLAADATVSDGQLAMVKDRVTTLHREFAGWGGDVARVLKEVA